jgi:hypothetical protein
MKKIFFLVVAIYVLSFISFRDPNENQESFAGIIKKDPTKIKDLLKVADSIRQQSMQKKKPIHKDDKKNYDELREFRAKAGPFKMEDNMSDYPVIKFAMEDIMEIIDPDMVSPNVDSTDSLTFYLGKYRSSGKWVKRYKERNNAVDIEFRDLKNRPALLIGTSNETKPNLRTYYDIQRICPPPSDAGCD